MSLTLKQQIDADTTPVFLQTDEFAEDVTHYAAGNLSAPATVQAVVDRDEEASGGVGSGEGADFDTASRVRLRRNAILELAASVVVTERSGTHQASPSLWEFDGFRWTTVRILSRDDSMQSVLVSRSDKIATRRLER